MAEDDHPSVIGRSTPDADAGKPKVGSRRAARPVDADSESTMVMAAISAEPTAQTYSGGRRAKAPAPVEKLETATAVKSAVAPATVKPVATIAEPEDTIVFPAIGEIPAGRIPGARRARARAATRSAARGRLTAFAGAAAIAIAALGSLAVSSPTGFLAGQDAEMAQNYIGTKNATNAVDVSRNYDRELAVQKPIQAQQKAKAIAQHNASIQASAQKRKSEIVRNQWVIPVVGYRLTARFGQGGGLWSSGAHTGLDFAGPSGSTIVSVAAGTVTSTGYEGAYGNRTIITLADGTEIWYCHQSSVQVRVGQKLAPGDVIGATGSTGNVTGPHLHLEVHPGGGGPIDPYSALVAHGVTP
ncbi:MAG TPA: M23 family metallopeptidase [Aeromicrobium sp.]|nr:M23 family metallopeptidase [Aeromicrobium sp.]